MYGVWGGTTEEEREPALHTRHHAAARPRRTGVRRLPAG
jgi:hypothetical protein